MPFSLNTVSRLIAYRHHQAVQSLGSTANMVKTPDDHRWSSYNAYIGETDAPSWLQRDFILAYFRTNITGSPIKGVVKGKTHPLSARRG